MLKIRPYTAQDQSRCLEIFTSNLEMYFDKSEYDEFLHFLKVHRRPYFMVEQNSNSVACGGYFVNDEAIGSLDWGMVERQHHKKDIGRQLCLFRIREMENRGAKKIVMDTTKFSVGFYTKLGFVIHNITENGYGENLDRIDLELLL